jgi:hypothetical protein
MIIVMRRTNCYGLSMRPTIFCLVAMGLLAAACAKKEEATQQPNLLTNNSSGNPLTAPVDYLGAINQGRKHAIKTIDQAGLNSAIQQFYAMEERFPKDLNELAQKRYVGAVPEPPPGSRFVYNPANGELKVVRQ